MKTLLRILLGVGAILLILIAFILIAGNKRFDAPYPDIRASTDPELIARGEYLVFGPAHCATCHVPMDKIRDVDNGLKMPLTGGWHIDIPPVMLYAPNLTPDPETGIGNLTDGEIARSLRYGVRHDGRYIMPVMPFTDMSDEDLTAIISYLRSQPPVRNEVRKTKNKFLGKALIAFGMLKPAAPEQAPPERVHKEVSVEYGGYLAWSVANCMGCHTAMDLRTGQFTSPPYSGGFFFEPDEFSQGYSFISPNLTPHEETGIMAFWTEDTFVARFKAGRVYAGSPMPWGAFSRMDTTDLRAIYTFLQSLEPVEQEIKKIVFEPGEQM